MNTPNDHPPLPSELGGLSASLDALGAGDRAGAAPGLEARLFTASRFSHLGVLPAELAPVSASLDMLAARERAGAPVALEARAFDLSSEAISGGRPAHAPISITTITTRRGGTMRAAFAMAAALGLTAGGLVVVSTLKPSTPSPVLATSDGLADRVDTEFAALFEVMETAYRQPGADASDAQGEVDAVWLEEIYGRESL